MKQWEYFREHSPGCEQLRILGEQGWELAAIEHEEGVYPRYVFKRPLPDDFSEESGQ